MQSMQMFNPHSSQRCIHLLDESGSCSPTCLVRYVNVHGRIVIIASQHGVSSSK